MGSIAEGLVLGVATAAQSDSGASAQTERLALRVADLEVAFDAD
jgi:hypothetical protein